MAQSCISSPAQNPPAIDPSDYRKALSCFATGVAVVSTRWKNSDWGMTCNSFSSVSLEPRLVLWSIRKASNSLPAFLGAGGFAVSILAQPQAHLAGKFSLGDMDARFAGVAVHRQESGRLRLADALAWFDCSLHQQVDAGDHYILIGQVKDFGWRDTEGLGMWRSRLGRFEPLTA